MSFFIMLSGQNGKPHLMVHDSGDPGSPTSLFETEEEADKAGEANLLGQTYGFTVYEWED